MEKIDMHIHTTFSDGDYNLDEVIKMAKNNDCKKIAITDHEVMKDFSNDAINNGIEIISGIEFNTSVRGLHLLGYGFENIDLVKDRMNKLHKYNEHVSFEVIDLLKKNGFDISKELVEEFLLSKDITYNFLEKRHIVKYLIDKGYASGTLNAYDTLIGQEAPYYIPIMKNSPEDIINLVKEAKGVSVFAHPKTVGLKDKELLYFVRELLEYGLDGIEVFNRLDNGDGEFLNRICEAYDLVKTVGSDFHTTTNNHIGIEVTEPYYENLKQKIKMKHS